MKRTILSALLTLAAPTLAHATSYELDAAHSDAGFVVKHMMVSNVHGHFKTVTGKIDYDDAKPENTKVDVEIETASIDTNNEKRDGHLKSPDFFDAGKFPKITFKSTSAKSLGGGKLDLTGELSMHGVTKPVTLHVDGVTPENKSPFGPMYSRGASATAVINRKDFGLNWNKALEAGGVLVGDEVKLEIEVEAVKKDGGPAKAAAAKK